MSEQSGIIKNEDRLLSDLRGMIEEAREQLAQARQCSPHHPLLEYRPTHPPGNTCRKASRLRQADCRLSGATFGQ
jgi:hypothetical protein